MVSLQELFMNIFMIIEELWHIYTDTKSWEVVYSIFYEWIVQINTTLTFVHGHLLFSSYANKHTVPNSEKLVIVHDQ